MACVALITDYGVEDHYAGVLKGVILRIAPKAQVVDATHDIRPHDIVSGAFVLRQSWPWYPPGTIFLVVVDPGVGTGRRIIAAKYAERFLVAPDNGLVTFVHRDFPVEAIHRVENPRYFLPKISSTFHGRDIMAPVTAYLANGVKLKEIGPAIEQLELLQVEHRARVEGGIIRGRVLHVDRFGNLVTNIHQDQLDSVFGRNRVGSVWLNDVDLGPVRAAFSEVAVGQVLPIVGSSEFVEIAINQGSAARSYAPVEALVVEIR